MIMSCKVRSAQTKTIWYNGFRDRPVHYIYNIYTSDNMIHSILIKAWQFAMAKVIQYSHSLWFQLWSPHGNLNIDGIDGLAFFLSLNPFLENEFMTSPNAQCNDIYAISIYIVQLFVLHWIGLRENVDRKPSIFPRNMGVSCNFSLIPIHWIVGYDTITIIIIIAMTLPTQTMAAPWTPASGDIGPCGTWWILGWIKPF